VSQGSASSGSALSIAEVASALAPFRVKLADSQLAAIARYVELLLYWNRTISLTSLEDPAEIVSRHFGESIFVHSFLPVDSGRLADVGTGAGFPGMALKIAFPDLQVTLIEPNRKKCAFLAEVQRELHISRVAIERSRYEDSPLAPQSLDFICARALGNYGSLLRWANGPLAPSGRVVLWLGTDDSVLVGKARGWAWELPVPIPGSERRVIMVGRPLRT
jgi:16S rRNA (guanine527-N7)-methyltransferase